MEKNVVEPEKSLMNSYEEMYNICYPLIQKIIDDQIKDIDLIEHTLDHCLDIFTEKGFYLFLKLVFYYSTVDLEKSYAYLNILQKDRKEEYDEYVKKLKK